MAVILPPNEQDYIDRIAAILKADSTLFPPTGPHLVTAILTNQPAILQSPDGAVIPYIGIWSGRMPLKFLEKVGRDGIDAEGGSVYEMEIYVVAVTNTGLTAETAQRDVNTLSQAVGTAMARNLRLIDPATGGSPLCRTHSRYRIPYVLPGTAPPNMRAINTVIRPQVFVHLREDEDEEEIAE